MKRIGRERKPIPLGVFPGSQLEILEELEAIRRKKYKGFTRIVRVKCLACGQENTMIWDNIKSGVSQSCGCVKNRKKYDTFESSDAKKKIGLICNSCEIYFHHQSDERVVCKDCFERIVRATGHCKYQISVHKEGVSIGAV